MGKTANCLLMLQILNSGQVVKISELANMLRTNPRNIIEYKKELEEMGYYIVSVPGKYGGYKLDKSVLIPALKMTSQEKLDLIDGYNFLLAKSDFLNKNAYTKSIGKVFSNLFIENNDGVLISSNKVNSQITDNKLEQVYSTIENAIKTKTKIEIKYNFLKESEKTILVDPYQLFLYDSEWRFFAWYPEKETVWYFKLSRVLEINNTNLKFKVWKNFKPEDYLKNNLFTPNGKTFTAILIATNIRAKLFKEKSYGSNQICEDLEDGTTKITLDLQENPSTYNFILGCGDEITVIEPKWLVDKIKNLSRTIYEKYVG